MQDRKLEIVIGAKDNYSSVMKKFEAAMSGAGLAANKASSDMSSVSGAARTQAGLLTGLNSAWVGVAAQIYIAQKALRLVGTAFAEMEKAAQFQQTEQAFVHLAESHGASAAQMIEDLRKLSGETISTAELMKSAGTAMVLGIPADKMDEMMEIARASARITGQSITKSFADISTGISRQSKQILDNLGIVVNADDAYKKYAETMRITGRELNDAEKKQAFINATMDSGSAIVKSIGVSGKGAGEEFATFTAKLEDLSIALGTKVLPLFTRALSLANSIIGTPLDVNDSLSKLGNLRAEQAELMGDAHKLQAQMDKAFGEKYTGGAVPWIDQSSNLINGLRTLAGETSTQLEKVNAQIDVLEKSYIAAHSTIKKVAETVVDPALQKAYDAMEEKIHAVDLAATKLTATKAELIFLDAQELAIAGVTATQLERYVDARQRQLDVENQLAAAKAKTAAEADAARQKESAQSKLAGLGGAPGAFTPEDEFSQAWLGYQAQLDALAQYNTQKMSLMAQAGASQTQMEVAYSEMVIDQEKKKRDLQLAMASQAFGGMSNMMQNLTVLTGKEGGAAFEMMKGFAIAQTSIDTYKAAQGAYAAMAGIPVVGPALGVAAAAAAVVAGLARVKQIASMQPGGSASGTTISAGGTANPSYSGGSPGAYPVPTRTEDARPALNVTVNAFALDPSQVNWDEMMEKQIAPALERLSGDRDVALNIRVVSR